MGVSKTHLSKNPNLKDLTLTMRPSALGFYGQIYLITNKVNGKTYIGQTVGSVNSRWRQHCCDSRRARNGKKSALKQAIDKYSEDNFELLAIELANSREELDRLEIKYIQEYKSLATENGYNIEAGGNFVPLSEVAMEKVRAYAKSQIGIKKGPACGKKAKGPTNSMNRVVLALNEETGEIKEYYSLINAAETFGVSKQSIRSAIEYGRRSCGLWWSYKDLGEPKVGKKTRGPSGKKISGINLSTGETFVFPNAATAARATKQAHSAIHAVCTGLYAQNKNFIWKYLNET